MMGEYSAHEIISQAEKLINPIDRIYLLRQWALHTTDYESAPEVVEYAFKLAIRTAEYTPSATHVRELATPPLCVNNSETSSPSTISVGAEKDSHLHEQDQW
jgi:hypothetical protein